MTPTAATATQEVGPSSATGAAVGSKVKRAAIPDIRRKMLDQGALLFRFEKPHDVVHKREHIVWWEQMEQLGFRVTRSGCILPYDNFCGSSKGRPKGHKISAYFFLGEPPRCQQQQSGGHPHGWPTQMQVSHRCHRKDCINPAHLVYEPQWKNLKRNYCGEHGSCDCGMQPPCVATYHNGDWQYSDDHLVTYSTDGYRRIVAGLVPGRRFVILPADHYESVDIKKRKRNERLHSKRKKSKASAPPTPLAVAKKEGRKNAKKCKEIKNE